MLRLIQDAVSSGSTWLRLFPVRGWRTWVLSSSSGPPTCWRCIRGWPSHMPTTGPQHGSAVISPFLSEGLAPSATTHSCLSGSSRGPPAGALGDLRVTVRASLPGTSPWTSYPSRSECPVWLHLHLHLVILQTLLSKATYNWGIHKAIKLEEANRQRKCP